MPKKPRIIAFEPVQMAAPLSIWKQIDTIAAQIEAPVVEFSTDPLAMAQAVVADNQRRANMLRRLIPAGALDRPANQ